MFEDTHSLDGAQHSHDSGTTKEGKGKRVNIGTSRNLEISGMVIMDVYLSSRSKLRTSFMSSRSKLRMSFRQEMFFMHPPNLIKIFIVRCIGS